MFPFSLFSRAVPAPAPHAPATPRALIDMLCPELLLNILDIGAATCAFHSYRARQDFLLATCLVSRAFDDAARVLLWQQLLLSTVDQLDLVREQIKRSGSYTASLMIWLENGSDPYTDDDDDELINEDLPAIFEMIRDIPNLDTLCFSGTNETVLGKSEFEAFRTLRRLALSGVTISAPLPSLPRLISLSLDTWTTANTTTLSWLAATNLPALRSLALQNPMKNRSNSSDDDDNYVPFDVPLLPQLALSTMYPNSKNSNFFTHYSSSKAPFILLKYAVDAHAESDDARIAKELLEHFSTSESRLVLELECWPYDLYEAPFRGVGNNDRYSALTELKAALRVSSVKPLAVVLPSLLHPSLDVLSSVKLTEEEEDAQTEMRNKARRIVRVCKRRRIPVFWRSVGAEDTCEMALPPPKLLEWAIRLEEEKKGSEQGVQQLFGDA